MKESIKKLYNNLKKKKKFQANPRSENDSLKARMTYLIDLEKQFEDSRIRAAKRL